MVKMSRDDGATVLLPRPGSGRAFSTERRVRLSDTTADGHLRLDALARYIQDIASDDARQTMTATYLAWVVRRTLIEVAKPAASEELCELTTWCSGFGGRWAERRTSLVEDRGARVDSAVVWVAINPETGAPARLPETFELAYGEAAQGRKVTARLQHGDPPDDGDRQAWRFRAADIDRLGHVNNAAYWTILEELLVESDRSNGLRAELEYRDAVEPGVELEIIGGSTAGWLIDQDSGVKASFTVSP